MPPISGTPLTAADRQLVLATARALGAPAAFDAPAFAPLLDAMRVADYPAGSQPLRAGDAPPMECFVLSGIVRSWVGDAAGRAVTLDFAMGPCALAPSIVRSADGCSRVHCEVLRPARLAWFDAGLLVQQMVDDPAIQRWGDAVLRAELMRRADREWALAVLPARERLRQLRAQRPQLEQLVPHHHIASYLGISPVSLSRLRAGEPPAA